MKPKVHESAVVDPGAQLGDDVRIWHFCHVMAEAVIGDGCSLGQNVFVAGGVRIGEKTRIQNNVSVYEGVHIGPKCFVGPSAVFTNVKTPRSEVRRKHLYDETYLEKGVTIGANATIVCGVRIGAYAVVGAGAVVTKDVAPHRLVAGVPARDAGWACKCGGILTSALDCLQCGRSYKLRGKGSAIKEVKP